MTWEPMLSIIGAAVLVAQQAVNFVVVRAVVRAEVSRLNGTYVRSTFCDERHRQTEHRLERAEEQLDA